MIFKFNYCNLSHPLTLKRLSHSEDEETKSFSHLIKREFQESLDTFVRESFGEPKR